jgi:hypothetical protein
MSTHVSAIRSVGCAGAARAVKAVWRGLGWIGRRLRGELVERVAGPARARVITLFAAVLALSGPDASTVGAAAPSWSRRSTSAARGSDCLAPWRCRWERCWSCRWERSSTVSGESRCLLSASCCGAPPDCWARSPAATAWRNILARSRERARGQLSGDAGIACGGRDVSGPKSVHLRSGCCQCRGRPRRSSPSAPTRCPEVGVRNR